MILTWDVNPILFSLGPIELRWYGLLFAGGFFLGLQITQRVFAIEKIEIKLLDPLLIYMMLGVVIGARLGHCLFYEPIYYLSNPLEILMVWKGGLASHGAGLGIFASLWFFSKKHPQLSFFWLLDRLAINIALAGGMIRLGNLMNSEIIGKPTGGGWGFVFSRIDQLPRHPSQLYESLFYLTLGGLLWLLYKRGGREEGLLSGIFLTLTFSFRFLVEFSKENQTLAEQDLAFNIGQILSLPLIGVGLLLLILSKRSK